VCVCCGGCALTVFGWSCVCCCLSDLVYYSFVLICISWQHCCGGGLVAKTVSSVSKLPVLPYLLALPVRVWLVPSWHIHLL
jgi:hypothetical protein